MNWHDRNAARLNYTHRNTKAHIVDNSRYGFYSLCGRHIPAVTVNAKNVLKSHNNTCKKCLAKLTTNNGETK